eukprot:1160355-Pelagomonas_calceolata.AAC.6
METLRHGSALQVRQVASEHHQHLCLLSCESLPAFPLGHRQNALEKSYNPKSSYPEHSLVVPAVVCSGIPVQAVPAAPGGGGRGRNKAALPPSGPSTAGAVLHYLPLHAVPQEDTRPGPRFPGLVQQKSRLWNVPILQWMSDHGLGLFWHTLITLTHHNNCLMQAMAYAPLLSACPTSLSLNFVVGMSYGMQRQAKAKRTGNKGLMQYLTSAILLSSRMTCAPFLSPPGRQKQADQAHRQQGPHANLCIFVVLQGDKGRQRPSAQATRASCKLVHVCCPSGRQRQAKAMRKGKSDGMDAAAKREARIKKRMEERQADVGAQALQVSYHDGAFLWEKSSVSDVHT